MQGRIPCQLRMKRGSKTEGHTLTLQEDCEKRAENEHFDEHRHRIRCRGETRLRARDPSDAWMMPEVKGRREVRKGLTKMHRCTGPPNRGCMERAARRSFVFNG